MKKQSNFKAAVVAIAVLFSATTTAFCQEDDKKCSVDKLIEELDKNADKSLSKEEIKSDEKLSANFDKIDLDKNGLIDKKELTAYMDKNKTS